MRPQSSNCVQLLSCHRYGTKVALVRNAVCGLRLEAVADVMFMTPQLRQKELLKLHGKKGLSCLPVDLTSMAQAMRRIPKESQKL